MINESKAWKKLQAHFEQLSDLHMRDLFSDNPERFEKFSFEHAGLLIDYSKNRITTKTLELLISLAREADVEGRRDMLFRGEPVDTSEVWPAMHPVLRDDGSGPAAVAGRTADALADKARLYEVCAAIREGRHTGFSGKPLRDIVSIGIGGSHLGPAMACHALAHLALEACRVFFVTSTDPRQVSEVLEQLDPERTLFVVTSKTFSTRETLANAKHARDWINHHCNDGQAWQRHFLVVTANVDAAVRFGIPADNVLKLWNNVSGRFSLWSSAGLPVVVLVGDKHFEELLAGARCMDTHFAQAPLATNMPVILALLDIWYVNFHGVSSRAVLPYDYALKRLPEYLQQLEMESNGKSVDRDGRSLPYATSPVVWGGSGPEGQHAFYQLLHQGKHLIPSDFIITMNSGGTLLSHDDIRCADFLAQAHALMHGNSATTEGDARRRNLGNQPSNALVLKELSPFTLGLLLALYEHKVFVQAVVWDINPFDQWGVELGKYLTAGILDSQNHLDSSTRGLRRYLSEL